jgi:hypothetical protein
MNLRCSDFLFSKIGIESFGKYISSNFFAIPIIFILLYRFSFFNATIAELNCPLPPSIKIKFGNGVLSFNVLLYLLYTICFIDS